MQFKEDSTEDAKYFSQLLKQQEIKFDLPQIKFFQQNVSTFQYFNRKFWRRSVLW